MNVLKLRKLALRTVYKNIAHKVNAMEFKLELGRSQDVPEWVIKDLKDNGYNITRYTFSYRPSVFEVRKSIQCVVDWIK